MAGGDPSQTKPVQICMFLCCVVLQIVPACSTLISLRVLLAKWCVLIDNKVNNLTGEL